MTLVSAPDDEALTAEEIAVKMLRLKQAQKYPTERTSPDPVKEGLSGRFRKAGLRRLPRVDQQVWPASPWFLSQFNNQTKPPLDMRSPNPTFATKR
jgi:hypothetical protein